MSQQLIEVRSRSGGYEMVNGQRVVFGPEERALRMMALGCPRDLAIRAAARVAENRTQQQPKPAKPSAPVYRQKHSNADGDASRRKLADAWGRKIAADAERDRKDSELREKMKAARGF
jgi:hypothetical protein